MKYRYDRRQKRRFCGRVVRGIGVSVPVLLFVGMGSVKLYAEPDTYHFTQEEDSIMAGSITDDDAPNNDKTTPPTGNSASTLLHHGVLGQSTPKSGSLIMPPPEACTTTSASLSGFETSTLPEIRKLSDYEKLCGGTFIVGGMLFTAMPGNTTTAVTMAKDTALRLKEFARFNLRPKVILEPLVNGHPIDFTAFARGDYDAALHAYYDALAKEGITNTSLGEVTAFPEPNIPEWGTTEPNLIAACITKAAQIQKAHFPASKTSILLDSKSYPSGTSWEGGKYLSLAPYVNPVPKGLIDSFGLQGYAWPDPDNSQDPGVFLSANQALEAARILGVSNIWFNTGTFKRGVAWNGKTFTPTPAERYTILNGIISETQKVRNAGLNAEIMLFSEDKFVTAERIDWSYGLNDATESSHAAAFKNFQHEAAAKSLPLYIFDTFK